ncbi:cyclin-dependent kinase-like 4 [Planococcus citri]|uniref:cyclin-dependent kinase-like 4 n=1 Tax=Planococcus citri TaxID=170843 RepID=UPI0031F8B1A1
MENYEVLSVAGEGSYGIVMKCRHRHSKEIVAIKKITDYNNDNYVKKMILREVRILKRLRHENLVQLFEVFKKKRRFYLVFEYIGKTVLDDLENNPKGLGEQQALEYIYQLIRVVDFCHTRNIIHRDIKPENLLISSTGILKLCDFGCARIISNYQDCVCTEYVATRWYRAPELLVRDRKYGKPVDVWAVGCVLAEVLSGEPLFPGQSDIDQLYMIMKCFGKLCSRHQQILSSSDFQHNNNKISDDFEKYSKNSMNSFHALHKLFPKWSINTINLVALCLDLDPEKRATAIQLLNNEYFQIKNINEEWFASLLQKTEEQNLKSLLKSELKHNKEFLKDSSTPHNFSGLKVTSNNREEKHLLSVDNTCLKTKSPDKKCDSFSSLVSMKY